MSHVPACVYADSGLVPPVFFGFAHFFECSAAWGGCISALLVMFLFWEAREDPGPAVFFILSVRDLFPMCNNFVYVVELV